jgi:3D (Asp-Asp-Asp) domain-containing protein
VRLDTTAYCWTGNHTASGRWPRIGYAASNLFPFGTRLRVPGFGVVTVEDRTDNLTQLDLYMGDAGCGLRATRFGRRSLLVEVLP